MEKLNEHQLMNISGGGLSLVAILGIGAALTFLIGVVDGFVRPFKCR